MTIPNDRKIVLTGKSLKELSLETEKLLRASPITFDDLVKLGLSDEEHATLNKESKNA